MIYGTIAPQKEAHMNERQERELSAWITVREAAAILGVSEQWTRYLASEKLIEAIRPGREWIIRRASVEAYKSKQDNEKQ